MMSVGALKVCKDCLFTGSMLFEFLDLIFTVFQYHTLLSGLSAITSAVVRQPEASPSSNVLETRKPENHASHELCLKTVQSYQFLGSLEGSGEVAIAGEVISL